MRFREPIGRLLAALAIVVLSTRTGGTASTALDGVYSAASPSLPYHVVAVNPRGGLVTNSRLLAGTVGSVTESFAKTVANPDATSWDLWRDWTRVNSDHGDRPTIYKQTDAYLEQIVHAIRELDTGKLPAPLGGQWKAYCEGRPTKSFAVYPERVDGITVRKILVFIHGGLNPFDGSLWRSQEIYRDILCSGQYPIFINWNSDLWSSYLEDITAVHQGMLTNYPYWSLLISPLYVLSDVARGLVRIPITGPEIALNAYESSSRCPGAMCIEDAAWHEFVPAIPPTPHTPSRARALANLMMPLQFITGSIVDGAGTGAWENMLRRIAVMFRADADFYPPADCREKGGVDPICKRPGGTISRFVDRVLTTLPSAEAKERWEITLVGHSMGAIVVNKIVRQFGDRLPISRIVHLAAASSIRDYEESVLPYLRRHAEDDEERPRYFNLMLHPKLELEEQMVGPVPFAPPGSLLVYIDDFLTAPATPLDRTLGRWANITRSAFYTPDDLRSSVAFTVCDDAELTPQTHGSFSGFPFWEPACWEPASHCNPYKCLGPKSRNAAPPTAPVAP